MRRVQTYNSRVTFSNFLPPLKSIVNSLLSLLCSTCRTFTLEICKRGGADLRGISRRLRRVP